MTKLWLQPKSDGSKKVVIDRLGRVISCPTCPCFDDTGTGTSGPPPGCRWLGGPFGFPTYDEDGGQAWLPQSPGFHYIDGSFIGSGTLRAKAAVFSITEAISCDPLTEELTGLDVTLDWTSSAAGTINRIEAQLRSEATPIGVVKTYYPPASAAGGELHLGDLDDDTWGCTALDFAGGDIGVGITVYLNAYSGTRDVRLYKTGYLGLYQCCLTTGGTATGTGTGTGTTGPGGACGTMCYPYKVSLGITGPIDSLPIIGQGAWDLYMTQNQAQPGVYCGLGTGLATHVWMSRSTFVWVDVVRDHVLCTTHANGTGVGRWRACTSSTPGGSISFSIHWDSWVPASPGGPYDCGPPNAVTTYTEVCLFKCSLGRPLSRNIADPPGWYCSHESCVTAVISGIDVGPPCVGRVACPTTSSFTLN